jgi:imidazoleglycerol-phosphate dehydratase
MRTARIQRKTKETDITLELNIDGNRQVDIKTGIPFFDHMLTLFGFHAGFDLKIETHGDLEVDDHHTVEDVGIALGQAFYQAIGQMKGINRYGMMYLPMDEALARAVIDISNRPYLYYKASYQRIEIGGLSLENVLEFFRAFVNESRMNLHLEVLYGENDHHKVEAIFKACARAIKEASTIVSQDILSTKGVL